MVQYAVFHEVQGSNSVTKIGDFSNMKYRLSTSYKYKIPRFLCNLCGFKDILSRYHYTVERWESVICWVPRPVFLSGCLSFAAPDSCGFLHLDHVSFPFHPECEGRRGVTGRSFLEPWWCAGGEALGGQLCGVPRSWRAEPAEAPGTRCHCSSMVRRPPVHFLGCEWEVAVGL